MIKDHHEECSCTSKIKVLISGQTMPCHKVRQIFPYQVPNKLLSPEKFAHHILLLCFAFRDEKQLLSGCPTLYQNKLHKQGDHDIIKETK